MAHWFDAIGTRGPDWFLTVHVRPGDAAALRALVRGLDLPGFCYYAARGVVGIVTAAVGDHDWYVDAGTHEHLVAPEPKGNRWISHTIAVEGGALGIVRGYAGYDSAAAPGELAASEHRVLAAVLDSDAIEVARWSVDAGGDGYPRETVAAGDGRASLRAHLGL